MAHVFEVEQIVDNAHTEFRHPVMSESAMDIRYENMRRAMEHMGYYLTVDDTCDPPEFHVWEEEGSPYITPVMAYATLIWTGDVCHAWHDGRLWTCDLEYKTTQVWDMAQDPAICEERRMLEVVLKRPTIKKTMAVFSMQGNDRPEFVEGRIDSTTCSMIDASDMATTNITIARQ